MWAFLATELLIFGALFTGYTVFRVQYAPSFEAASQKLNLLIGTINTVVLLTSSLTMALAVAAARQGRKRMLVWCLGLTGLLGAAFLGIKAVEYTLDYYEHLVPGYAFDPEEWRQGEVNPEHVPLFLVFYYVMTCVHSVHLILAVAVIGVLTLLAWRGAFPPEHYTAVESWGLYWHFVDIVWIFLLPLLYLIGTRTHWT